jgi:hypothetical protein
MFEDRPWRTIDWRITAVRRVQGVRNACGCDGVSAVDDGATREQMPGISLQFKFTVSNGWIDWSEPRCGTTDAGRYIVVVTGTAGDEGHVDGESVPQLKQALDATSAVVTATCCSGYATAQRPFCLPGRSLFWRSNGADSE